MDSRAVPGGRARLSAPRWHPSPNFGPRRDGARPDMVILHYTAMEGAAAALERLCEPGPEVSAHYLLGADGTVWQLVAEEARAWHAGAGAWGDVDDVNSRSIGIELANRGDHPFAAAQMAALEHLLAGVMARWAIPPERVLGHSDIALGRKIDPGPRFDWRRLACGGLAVWPAPAAPGDFLADARRAGYRWAGTTEDAETLVRDAFRLRFRPSGRGPVCAADRAMMAGLAAGWPCLGGD
ncbi:N-acetylmuramoyl-L-alanine amidase [Rhodosalinus sp. FB01]|uniref:N-acetylmuramoyl-L-alanine amidase n=1 Tax=Rhodosalinus sp. FB01 TaxID=3239194 RepID=UPI003523B1FF